MTATAKCPDALGSAATSGAPLASDGSGITWRVQVAPASVVVRKTVHDGAPPQRSAFDVLKAVAYMPCAAAPNAPGGNAATPPKGLGSDQFTPSRDATSQRSPGAVIGISGRSG